jgi:hypothetical protein
MEKVIEGFKAFIMMLSILVAAIMIIEGAIWSLRSMGMVSAYPGTQHPAQFSILLHTPQPIAHFHSELT